MKIKDISCPVCGSYDTLVKERQKTDVHGLFYTSRIIYCQNCRSNITSNLYNLECEPVTDVFGRTWYSCPECGYYHNGDNCEYEEFKNMNSLGIYELVAFHDCPMCDNPIEETVKKLREEEYDDYREYYE